MLCRILCRADYQFVVLVAGMLSSVVSLLVMSLLLGLLSLLPIPIDGSSWLDEQAPRGGKRDGASDSAHAQL